MGHTMLYREGQPAEEIDSSRTDILMLPRSTTDLWKGRKMGNKQKGTTMMGKLQTPKPTCIMLFDLWLLLNLAE